MPVSPKGECVLHYVPYGAFRSSHCSSPTARRPMAPSHAVVRSNARSLEGTCSFIHRLSLHPGPGAAGGRMKVRPTSLNPGRQAHFTPFFALHVPLSRTSGAPRKRIRLETGGESVLRRRWEVVPGKPVAARGLVNGWMALAPDGMERSGRFSRHHLPTPGLPRIGLTLHEAPAGAGREGGAMRRPGGQGVRGSSPVFT